MVAYSLFGWRVLLHLWLAFPVCLSAAGTSYLWPMCDAGTHTAVRFAWLMAIVTAMPRVLSALLCSYHVRPYAQHPPPVGQWVFVGNPFPEFGVVVAGSPGASVGAAYHGMSVRYLQTPTWGGIVIAALHCFFPGQFYPDAIFASAVREPGGAYLVPTLKNPRRAAKARWKDRLVFAPVSSTVWARSEEPRPEQPLYYWMHASVAPWDDFLDLPQSPRARLTFGLASVAAYVAVNALTLGVVACVDAAECVLKRAQLWLVRPEVTSSRS